jgi:acetyl-CoA acetyltransferase
MTRAPLGDGQGRKRLSAVGGSLRHDNRLAFRQSHHEGAIRRRLHAGNRRELAEEHQISRADQDKFALRSQQRAGRAIESGFFADEIVRVHAKDAKGKPTTFERDEHPRPQTTLDDLAKLKAPFRDPAR